MSYSKIRSVTPYYTVLVALSICMGAIADDDEGHMHHDTPVEFHPINGGSKTFHWILTLALLLLMPSVSSALAFGNKLHWSLFLQFILTGYLVVESLFLDFPDNSDNHENRTSKGTSWFLSLLLGATIFMGSFINGSNLVINKFYPHLSTRGQYGITYKIYKTLSFLVVLTGWVRVCMAPVALFGFCYGIHTGQCIAHGIMGSSFIFYGFVLAFVLVIPWIRQHSNPNINSDPNRRSQEFYDSSLMCLWGIVNTFTEHRWGREGWSHGDYQHTAMGIIWWCGGLVGMWLTRKNNARSFVPALLLVFTGYGMSQHAQHLEISTKVHAMFGLALMGGGFSRIIEILLILQDKGSSDSGKILSFQHMPPFCLILAGVLFMSANEEQLILVKDLGADHSAYILVVTGAAFIIYLWMLLLLSLYLHLVGYDENGELGLGPNSNYQNISAHDAEEFELGDLSEGETDEPSRSPTANQQ